MRFSRAPAQCVGNGCARARLRRARDAGVRLRVEVDSRGRGSEAPEQVGHRNLPEGRARFVRRCRRPIRVAAALGPDCVARGDAPHRTRPVDGHRDERVRRHGEPADGGGLLRPGPGVGDGLQLGEGRGLSVRLGDRDVPGRHHRGRRRLQRGGVEEEPGDRRAAGGGEPEAMGRDRVQHLRRGHDADRACLLREARPSLGVRHGGDAGRSQGRYRAGELCERHLARVRRSLREFADRREEGRRDRAVQLDRGIEDSVGRHRPTTPAMSREASTRLAYCA